MTNLPDDIQVEHNFDNMEINKEVIRKAISKMKKKKAHGFNSITTELIEAGREVDMLDKIFNKILNSKKSPKEFSRMIVSPVYKKGDRQSPENY